MDLGQDNINFASRHSITLTEDIAICGGGKRKKRERTNQATYILALNVKEHECNDKAKRINVLRRPIIKYKWEGC